MIVIRREWAGRSLRHLFTGSGLQSRGFDIFFPTQKSIRPGPWLKGPELINRFKGAFSNFHNARKLHSRFVVG